jgi:hypothetical protein
MLYWPDLDAAELNTPDRPGAGSDRDSLPRRFALRVSTLVLLEGDQPAVDRRRRNAELPSRLPDAQAGDRR